MGVEIELQIDESGNSRPSRARVSVAPGLVIYHEENGGQVVLDFERRRRLKLDALSRTYSEDSLLTTVTGRHIELPNRTHVRQVIEAGGFLAADFTPLAVEHQLAIKDPELNTSIDEAQGAADTNSPKGGFLSLFKTKPPRRDIEVKTVGPQMVYGAEDLPLLSHSRDGQRMRGAVAGYVQFIRYRYGGHPLILERVAALDFVPREVTLHALAPASLGGKAVCLRVEECRERNVERPGTSRLEERTPFFQDSGEDMLRDAREAARRPQSEPVDAQLESSLRALSAGDALQGFLSFCELTLETGIAMPPELAEAIKASSDKGLKNVVTALGCARSTQNAEAVEFSLRAYAKLRLVATSKAHVLWAFEANLRACRGETEEAKQLLIRTIGANPRLAGAYKDLGDVFLRELDEGRAWACWETARSIAPSHPVLGSVRAFEEMLLARYPEYFVA